MMGMMQGGGRQAGRNQRGSRRNGGAGSMGNMMNMMQGGGKGDGGARMNANRNMMPGGAMSGGGNRFAGAPQGERDHGVTIESTQTTELQKVSGS